MPPAHRVDPRVSLVCILLIGLSTFASASVAVELAAMGGCVLVGIWCGRPSSALRWAAAWAALFVLCWLCAHSGVVLMAVGASLAMLRRMLCAFMMAANMVGTTRTGGARLQPAAPWPAEAGVGGAVRDVALRSHARSGVRCGT